MFAPGQNRSVKWHKTRPARWPSFARYRNNVYARIAGGRTRRRSRGKTESCATDGLRAAPFRCASADRQASWFKATIRSGRMRAICDGGIFEIVQQLPESDGECQYKIKSLDEPHLRVAKELQLRRV